MISQPRLTGTVHLASLPGSATWQPGASMTGIIEQARRDAAAYAAGGFDALIVENFGDVPFYRDSVPLHTVAAMTLATEAVQRESGLPVGVNVLRNDAFAAISIAAITSAGFVRVNVYVGAAITDQGIIEGQAAEAQALIRKLGNNVQIWADVDVKHATPLAPRPIGEIAEEAIFRGLAAAVIVSGKATGAQTSLDDLWAVRQAIGDRPLYAGSGVTVATIADTLAIASGVIIGGAAKFDGNVANPVDPQRVRALVRAANDR